MVGNNDGNKRPAQRSWSRSGGKRLSRSESQATVTSTGDNALGLPLIHDRSRSSYEEIRDQLIVQEDVTPKYHCFRRKCLQDSWFLRLPEEITAIIFDFLPFGDILTMAKTCKSMAEFVNRNFVPSLILPLSPQNLKKLDGRKVLCLKSNFNIMALEELKEGEYLNNLEKIQLSNLQKLVFVLHRTRGEDPNPLCGHILPPLYKDVLSHYLSVAKQLTHLHVAIDRSEETFHIIDVITKGLPCLSNLDLKSTNTPNNIPLPFEGQVSQDIKEKAANLQIPGRYPHLTLNELLNKVLKKPSLRSLGIRGLFFAHNWDADCSLWDSYPLVIRSKSLTHLKIIQDAFCHIEDIYCPELRRLNYIDLGGDDFQVLECLIHHDAFDGAYKTMLTVGCPKLDLLNDIDIQSLRNRLTDQYSFEEWQELLETVCNCEMSDSEEEDSEGDSEEKDKDTNE